MNETLFKRVAAALLTVLVVACGGGSDSGTTVSGNGAAASGGGGSSGAGNGTAGSAPASAPAPTAKAVAIDAEGDSLIWGYSGTDAAGNFIQSPNNPPAVMQSALQAQFGAGVTVQNNAITGSQVAQSLNGTSPYTVPFATRLATSQAKIVLADYAANDSVAASIDSYKADLATWIADVRAAGKVPVLEEPNPMCSSEFANLGAFRDAMVSVAQSQNVLLITQYDYIASLPNWQSMLLDCIHPDDDLYRIKGEREAAQLASLVHSLQ